MGMSLKQIIFSASVLVVFAAFASADSLVYVVSAGITGNGTFGTVDLNTGAFQQIGPGEPDGYFGLAPGPNGSLVSLTYTGNLDSIEPATGVPTRIGPTGLGNCINPLLPARRPRLSRSAALMERSMRPTMQTAFMSWTLLPARPRCLHRIRVFLPVRLC